MNKETFLCRLRAIVREVTCMSDSVFKERFQDDMMKFAYFTWDKPAAKIITQIKMKRIKIEEDTVPLSEGIDPPAEQLPPPTPIPVSHEEYERLISSFHAAWPRVYMSKEDLKKWFPDGGVPTPNWEALKNQIEGFIEEMQKAEQ